MSIKRSLHRLGILTRAYPRSTRGAAAMVLTAVLLAPSIWMLCVIPPLWRDVDAYIQVTEPPGMGTILLYGPLYCFVARIPLYLGYVIDCLRTGAPFPILEFFRHPKLTDSGVFLLLLVQHAALGWSAFRLITLISPLFVVRLILAIAWAANPLFYTFAHCVGTETLSMILLLLLGAIGLRTIQRPRSIDWKDWLCLGLLLWLCILTRHINALLAALMPLTFFLLGVCRLGMIPFVRSRIKARWERLQSREAFKKGTVAVAVGLSCIVLANASLRGLCHIAHIPYYSTVGFTFLFRLGFLTTIPPEKRNQLLERVAKNSGSPEVEQIISLLRDSFPDNVSRWDAMALNHKAEALPFAQKGDAQEKSYYLGLGRTIRAFLYPPEKLFLSAVAADFKTALKGRIPDAVAQLFVSTRHYFLDPETMTDYSSLSTFRGANAAQIMAVFKKHHYFYQHKNIRFEVFAMIWMANLFLLAVLALKRKKGVLTASAFAVALMLAGVLMMLANCLLNEFQPRYTLPMWELAIISASVLFGKTLELLLFATPAVSGFDPGNQELVRPGVAD